jgi:hypothetical protein
MHISSALLFVFFAVRRNFISESAGTAVGNVAFFAGQLLQLFRFSATSFLSTVAVASNNTAVGGLLRRQPPTISNSFSEYGSRFSLVAASALMFRQSESFSFSLQAEMYRPGVARKWVEA